MRQMTSRKAETAAAIALALLATGAGFLAFGQDVTDGNLPQPKLVIMDKSLPADQAESVAGLDPDALCRAVEVTGRNMSRRTS